MRWLVRVETADGHVHCRFFVSPSATENWAGCGELTVHRGAEFVSLMKGAPRMSFLADDDGNLFDATGDYAESCREAEL